MPAANQPEQQERQLELLEDEVFDFDDINQQAAAIIQEPRSNEAASAAAQKLSVNGSDAAAAREARDTRDMIASMLDQQQLISVDTSPSAYLEYLRIIFNCARLLRQPAMPNDLHQSVTSLLAKAKPLFCSNAFSLIVQTVNAFGGGRAGPPIPTFWGETFSQHECQLWIELIETVFFFWSDTDPAGLYARRRDDVVVETFAVGLLDRLGDLRAAYAERAPADNLAGHRVEQLARDIRRRLRPCHLLALARYKKAEKSLQLALAAFDCFLEAAGALPTTSPASLGRTKAALEAITFEQVRTALRLHRPSQFAACLPRLQRLRQRHLCRPELRELHSRLRDVLLASGLDGDAEVPEFLASFTEYAAAASDFEVAWQRAVVRNSEAIGPFLLQRLSSLVAKNIARAKTSGCWDSLSEPLRADLQLQSERRLSALTEARPAVDGSRNDATTEEGDNRGNGCVTFELDFVVSRSSDFCPEFVLPEQLTVTVSL